MLGTCHAGGLVPAQHRVRVMGSSNTASPNHVSIVGQSDPPSCEFALQRCRDLTQLQHPASSNHSRHSISTVDPSIIQDTSPTTGSHYLLKPLPAQRRSPAPSPLKPQANVVSGLVYVVCSSRFIVVFQIVWAASDMYEFAFNEVPLHRQRDRMCALIGVSVLIS